MLAQQELRFQSMMNQMMQHMMSMQQAPTSGGRREFTDEGMNEINAAYAEQMEQDTLWAVHGDEAAWMTPQERTPVLSPPIGFPSAGHLDFLGLGPMDFEFPMNQSLLDSG